MMRLIVAFTILTLGGRIAEFQTSPFGNRSTLAPFQSTCRALLGALSGPVLERLGGTLLFSPQVDGGGADGGDGGDGSGTGEDGDGNGGAGTNSDGSTGGDVGAGEENSGDSDSNGDGPSSDPAAVRGAL